MRNDDVISTFELRVQLMRYLLIYLILISSVVVGSETPVSTDVVRLNSVKSMSKVASRVVARDTLIVSSKIDERVSQIRVAVGDRVNKGDLLVLLEDENIALRIGKLEIKNTYLSSLVELLSKQEAVRVRQVERANKLNTRDFMTRDATELAELNLIETRTDLAKARYELAETKLALSDARKRIRNISISADTSGRILNMLVSVGQYIERGDDLLQILPDDGLELEAELRADIFKRLKIGQFIKADLEGKQIDLKLRALLAEENQRTGARYARFSFAKNLTKEMLVGQVVELELPSLQMVDALTVPKDAIVFTPGGPVVVLVVDGKAKPTSVVLGSGVEDQIIIEKGLSAGDVIVVEGQENLRKGQGVSIIKGYR